MYFQHMTLAGTKDKRLLLEGDQSIPVRCPERISRLQRKEQRKRTPVLRLWTSG